MLSTTSTAVNLLPDFSFTLAVSLESSGVIWCRISIWLPSHNTVKASYCDSLTKCSLLTSREVGTVDGPNLTPLMRTQKFVELDARAAD